MKIAILYQQNEPPVVNGIRKPMKKGGYSDSGADIAYCLQQNNINIITSAKNPDIYTDTDWVFPDTVEGIESALNSGADTLWLNTVLYKEHPITKFKGINVIGQNPLDASKYDDKYFTNQILNQHNFPVVNEEIIGLNSEYTGEFPCVLKPIRGRGSQGVVKCSSKEEFELYRKSEIEQKIYGDKLIVDEYLCGNEITISVFPDGTSLPIVERFNHNNGIAPYNGDVPVTENSTAITDENDALHSIRKSCEEAVKALNLKGLVRIDCRANKNGDYKIFDFNLKPNMTGAVRPHRLKQNCLTMISAKALGWSYFDLLSKMIKNYYTI